MADKPKPSSGPPPNVAPVAGNAADAARTNEEMVRKLLAMNPTLRQGQSTAELVHKINQKNGGGAAQPAAPATQAVNLVTELEALRVEFDQAQHQLMTERRTAEEQKRQLVAEKSRVRVMVCQELVSAIRRIDINLTDRKNQVLLDKEKAFLAEVGFKMESLLK